MTEKNDKKSIQRLRALYPALSESEIHEARENLARYLSVVVQIYERLRRDPKAYRKFRRLTADPADGAMEPERSTNREEFKKRDV